jgi:cell division protein FtsX
MKKILNKNIKIYDANTTPIEIIQHSLVNFLYGMLNGLVIAAVAIGNPYLILIAYYVLKQVESKVLNRNKYTSKLGKLYIFPIPSTIGFLIGWKISLLFKM